MSEIVTLEVPDELAERARAVAAQTHRPMEEVLLEWLARVAADVPVEELPDAEVLALRDLQLDAEEQAELSELLARQREGRLSDDERGRLDVLMRSYRQGMVRKAQALKVAVERGLQPPLS
jgi:predicted transcriptional regulator